MMKRYLINFLMITNLFVFGGCNGDEKYKFKMNYILDLEKSKEEIPDKRIMGRKLPSKDNELIDLCMAGKEFRWLDLMTTEDDIVAFKPKAVQIVSTFETWPARYFYTYIFGCNTLPKSWIFSRGSDNNNEYFLVMESSDFVDYQVHSYRVRTVKSRPTPCAEDEPESKAATEQSLYLKGLDDLEIFHICMNSKRHVGPPKPVLRNAEIPRRVFKFDLPTGEEKIYAFECPSTPAMYPYFVQRPGNSSDIRVIVFEPESPSSNAKLYIDSKQT